MALAAIKMLSHIISGVPNNIESGYQIRLFQEILNRVPNSIQTGYLIL